MSEPKNPKADALPIHLEARKQTGQRLFSPTAARNKEPLSEVLAQHLPKDARVLEIASGTGEHGVAFCAVRPDIFWMPSDPDAQSRASIADWASQAPNQISLPRDIDTSRDDWWDLGVHYNVVYNANMIHIAPINVLEGLARGAGQGLLSGGMVIIYGPFLFGEDSAPSNLEFDVRLKLRNPEWGVRELGFVKDIFAESGLEFVRVISMPANNHCVIFTKP